MLNMKNVLSYVFLGAVLSLMVAAFTISVVSADVVHTESAADTEIEYGTTSGSTITQDRRDRNYGANTTMRINRNVNNNMNTVCKAYVKFIDGSLSSPATIASAKLEFNVTSGTATALLVYGLIGADSVHDWVEGTGTGGTGTSGVLTWNLAANDYGMANQAAGPGVVTTNVFGGRSLGGAVSVNGAGTYTIDVTDYIKSLNGQKATFIFISSTGSTYVASKENPDADGPILIINRTTTDPAVAVTTSASGYTIDGNKVIIIPNTDTAGNFMNNIAVTGGATKTLYTDSTLSTLATTYVHNDMILEVKAENVANTVAEYYTIRVENEISLIKDTSYSYNNGMLQISGVLEETPLNLFLDNIEVYADAQKAVLESDGVTPVTDGSIQNGMKLKITAESGGSESIYTVTTTPCILGGIQTTIGGQPTDTLTAGNVVASVPVQSYKPVTLILAKYENGQLTDCKMAFHPDNPVNPMETLSASFDVGSVDGVTVKAMMWNGLESMQSLSVPKSLVPADVE